VLTSDAVVVLPGNAGTKTELDLALQYGRPTILFIGKYRLHGRTADDLQEQHAGRLQIANDKTELSARLRRALEFRSSE
jgi:predicted Rossmann-fold nucleotide-binding protein